jgi:tetratricopeptide (TPR) repeat protein
LGVVLQEQRQRNELKPTAITSDQLEKEIFHFREAIRLAPDHRGAHTNLGIALVEKGHLDEAISHYRYLLNQDPENLIVQNNLSDLLSKKGKNGDVRYFNLAQKFGRDSSEIHNNIGVFLARSGKVDEAVARFRLALQKNPDCRSARYNLQRMIAPGGMVDQAIDQLEKAAKKSHNEFVFYRLGNLYREKDELEKARTYYETALSIHPDYIEALDKLALVYSRMGQYDTAISLYKKLVQMIPNQAPLYYAVASLSARQGREGQALSWLQDAIEKGYNNQNRISADKNFDAIRNTDRYQNIIKAMQ